MMRKMGIGMTALALLLLAGCGSKKADNAAGAEAAGATESAASTADFDPCSVLSADEATAITTDKVIKVERQEHDCVYQSTPEDMRITVYPTGGAEQMEIMHNTAKLLGGMGAAVADKGGAGADVADMLKSGGKTPPAIGDEAMWLPNTTLAVRKGEAFVQVSPPIMHDPANHPGYPIVPEAEKRAIAQKVAEKILARLAH